MRSPDSSGRSWPEIDDLADDATLKVAPAGGVYPVLKLVLDYVVTVALLFPALPIMGICWVFVRMSSTGPGIYSQTRVGIGGRNYRIFKLRTMYHNCELDSGVTWAARKDNRVFLFGKFLRATHLDELPQLFNVLLGHMSLIGPRPERPEVIEVKELERRVPGYRQRLQVRPGVTGLAQIQLPPDLDVASVRHKVVYDLYYIQHQTLWLDARIILATALKAAGVKKELLQRLFFLPSRQKVARLFQERIAVPARVAPATTFQPA